MPDTHEGTYSKCISGCRCENCTQAAREYSREWKRRAKEKKIPKHVHGSEHGYNNYGCRCLACTTAKARASKARYEAAERRRRQALRVRNDSSSGLNVAR